MHFRVKFWARVKIKLQIVLKPSGPGGLSFVTPFVLYIGKTCTSHGPNMVHFKSDVISVKKFKKLKNAF